MENLKKDKVKKNVDNNIKLNIMFETKLKSVILKLVHTYTIKKLVFIE